MVTLVVPETLALRLMLALLPVAVCRVVVVPETELATFSVPLLVNVNVLPLEVPETVTPVVSVTITLPVLLAMTSGEVMVIGPIAPDAELSITVPAGLVAVTVPPV